MDMDRQADEAWILGIQSKLYQWSWGSLTSPCLLESRMRNESRKSGSGRGGKKPVAEKRYGACRLLLLATLDLSAIYGSYEAKDGRGQPAYALERGPAHETGKVVRLEKMSIENKRLTEIKETQSSCMF
jgi:hypothetical protein